MRYEDAFGVTPVDPTEAQGLKLKNISTQRELNEFESKNIAKAVSWAFNRRRKDFLTESFFRKLHKKMFSEVWVWAGEYRKSDKNIGVTWELIPEEIGKLLGDSQYWIDHQPYSWDELAARFHHRLVWVHAFPNGNGRHARLMTDILLQYNSQPLRTWGESLPKEKVRDAYLTSLRAADQGDFSILIRFMKS
ncbi:MAG TPA: mobile mystery protein B [Bdellovibrionota bacterium]|nr:mobile mystery protein B [Bdellovibrionota bacterium]